MNDPQRSPESLRLQPHVTDMRRPRKSINQINVVPYIDVMLVLLVIFMVTAPLVNPGEIELPSVGSKLDGAGGAAGGDAAHRRHAVARATSRRQRRRVKVSRDELVARVRAKQARLPDQPVVIAADKNARYEDVLGDARPPAAQRRARRSDCSRGRRRQLTVARRWPGDRPRRARARCRANGRRWRSRSPSTSLHRGARLLAALAEPQARAGDRRALRAAAEGAGCAEPARRSPPPPPPPSRSPRPPAQARRPRREARRRSRRPKAAPKPEPKVEKPDPRAAEIAQKARRRRKSAGSASRRRAKRRSARRRKPSSARPRRRSRTSSSALAEARERQQREADALQAQAEREQAARAAQQKADAEAAARARAEADYIRRIQAKVKGNVVLPPDIAGNPEAIFDVVQLPTGEIIDAVLRKSSGVARLRRRGAARDRQVVAAAAAGSARSVPANADAEVPAAGLDARPDGRDQ